LGKIVVCYEYADLFITWLIFTGRAAVLFNFKLAIMNKLQILGILLFIAGNFYGKSNLLPFLIGCLTGLKPDLQG